MIDYKALVPEDIVKVILGENNEAKTHVSHYRYKGILTGLELGFECSVEESEVLDNKTFGKIYRESEHCVFTYDDFSETLIVKNIPTNKLDREDL